jgi:S1-C subfamily serine protease
MKLLRFGIVALILVSVAACSDKPVFFNHILSTAVKITAGDMKGSGTLIGSNLILTAKHVAEVDNLEAQTYGGVKRKAVKVWESPDFDVAVLKMDGPAVAQGARFNCDPIEWTEPVQWIGNPLILDWNYGTGYVSTPKPNTRGELAIVGAVNPGDSGSGVFSESGRLRGVAVAYVIGYVNGLQETQSGLGIIVPTGVFCKQLAAGLEKDFPDLSRDISKR